MDASALPTASAGGAPLVSAMAGVDRVVSSFAEDFGRSVALVRSEVTRERDTTLAMVEVARMELEQARTVLLSERERFEGERLRERAELDTAWQEVYAARDRDAGLRAAAENALREASAVAALADASERRAQAQAFAHPPFARQAPVEESLPAASRAPSHALLFAVGGLSKASTPLDSVEALHTAEQAWRPLPRLSCARAYCAAAAAGPAGRQGDCALYVTGGSGGAAPLDSCEALPPGEGAAWRRVARMATRRVWHAAAALGERVYVAGGYDGTRYLSCCEVLDMAQDAPRGMWRTLSPLGRGRSTLGLASLSGLLYAVGGFCAPNYLATVEAYDPTADAWWSCPPLREPRRELGVAALQQHGMLIACGGYDGERYVAACEGFDPRANAWKPLAPLKRPRQLLGLAAAGGLAYAVGGFDGRSAGGWVEAYEPRMDAWREAPSLSGGPRMGHGLAAVLAG